MRRPVIAANWKMYKTAAEAGKFCRALLAQSLDDEADKVIFAPFTALSTLQEELKDSDIAIGAQNFYPKADGAYTGEISLGMLKEFDVKYVLIGHSERREIFHETDELIAEKLKAALNEGFIPILCVGESLVVREKGEAHAYCLRQIKEAVADIAPDDVAKIIIAYEPIWAIGSGKSATAADAEEMLAAIRGYLRERYGSETVEKIRILYGGSVKPENIAQFMNEEDIDGALIGGASLKAESYGKMIRWRER